MYTHEQITSSLAETEVDEALKEIYNRLTAHRQRMIRATEDLHYKLGKEIYAATGQSVNRL